VKAQTSSSCRPQLIAFVLLALMASASRQAAADLTLSIEANPDPVRPGETVDGTRGECLCQPKNLAS
jgi:hypothetical protein